MAAISSNIDPDRRRFLQTLGGGLLVLWTTPATALAQESGGNRGHSGQSLPESVNAWLHIAPDGKITAFTGKVEVGQNIRTSLSQAIADELRCDPAAVNLVMGDTAVVPWDAGTFGSRTTPTMAPEVRRMAATAREVLLDEAAKTWSQDRSKLKIEKGCIVDTASGRKAEFGGLAQRVNWVQVSGKSDCVTSPPMWQVAGSSVPKLNGHEIVTGKHKYPSDQKLPGMLYGRVLRPPSFGAKLTSVDTAAAEKMKGVRVVRDGDFIAIAADDEQTAQRALLSIKAEWQQEKQISADELTSYIRTQAAHRKSPAPPASGSSKCVQSTYTVAYIAHVPLEPRAALADYQPGKLTVWTGTQRPFGVRSELAAAFQLPEEQVRVIMPDCGSGYGGKHSGECAVEAARISKLTKRPVKVIWTREEEFTWAYFRPAGIIDVAGAIDKTGALQSWEFDNYLSGPSGLQTPYEITSKREEFHAVKSPLRDGSYRGLASTANHFARECHMDELATAAGLDPLIFRQKNLKNARLAAVLSAAADRFGWSARKASSTRGFGIACGMEKGGYVACCAEVSIAANKQVRVERVVEAWECGAIVNPEHLKNQVEGAIVMGLGGALFESIDFGNGRILNPRLSQYRVPRFSDVPDIELVLIDRKDIPSAGAGETPIVGIAPAIANAIYSATGIRLRSMPLLPSFLAT
ncbi:MAG TPA: molybdopterin cofactor-binding domain-containing protein [Bryobacteraceae bacterium]|jgi:isoquinoline 1-oxidoreductase|nr:molybdopterin cofactor-binding domain-containing protein [Bryobacteraceae bacterium]